MSEKCDCGVPFCKQCFPVPPGNTMRVYIAGPMRGHESHNRRGFDRAEKDIVACDHIAISPHRFSRAIWGDIDNAEVAGEADRRYLREIFAIDFHVLSTCDAIYMLRGWEESKGATAELAFAMAIGLKILYEDGAQESVINWSGKDRA